MCRIMINSASREFIFGFRNRSERLQQIQTLTNEIKNNEREIANKERKIVEIDSKIKTAENIIEFTQKRIDANNQVIKDTEALISNNEKIIKTTEELLSCYKALLANNESQKNITIIDSDTLPTKEERVISMTAYEKAKQDLADLNLDLKTNKHLIKVVEKKLPVTTDQSVDDSKSRMTAYNILNDCFNKFRLNYLFAKR